MKSPEDVKKGLECMALDRCFMLPCSACAYHGRGLPPCRMAVYADALALITALLAALKKCDLDCDYCKHNPNNDARCIGQDEGCERCEIACPCRSCKNRSNWEWGGTKEV